MKSYKQEPILDNHPLGKLSTFETKDGSISLRSSYFREAFHSKEGARREALEKFIISSQIDRFHKFKRIKVLDVCVGLGYNTACLIEALLRNSIRLNWFGLEIDSRPLKIALQTDSFKRNWSSEVLSILQSINSKGNWKKQLSEGNLLLGDARETLLSLPKKPIFDLILLDAFSPTHCPELWSEEFIHSLANRLIPDGRIITYCSAAAIRGSFRRAGLFLNSIKPNEDKKNDWSAGTIAILPDPNKPPQLSGPNWQPLTIMEEEHLNTRAAIPYRDPSRKGSSKEILQRRKEEQQHSNMEKTKFWQLRWRRVT